MVDHLIRYVNSAGSSIDLNPPNYYLQDGCTFHDWGLSRKELNGRTVSMSKGSSEKSFAIGIASDANGLELRDALYDVASIDIEGNTPGKLYIDDWYMKGYIASSSMSSWQYTDKAAIYSLTFVSDEPYWTREHVFELAGRASMGCIDYPHNFAHDYGRASGVSQIDNPDIVPSEFRMVMFGPCSLPSVAIGGNIYRVDTSLIGGEQLIIDSLGDGKRKTVVKNAVNGTETNVFNLRHGTQKKGSGSYCFEPIPPSVSPVEWSGDFSIMLTVYERRLQRRWA